MPRSLPLGRVLPAALALALVPLAATLPTGARADAPPNPRAQGYEATIRWTPHGIPHITADDFGSLGFGSGYAASSLVICTLYDTVVTGRGERSLHFGADARYNDQVTLDASNLQVDTVVGDLHAQEAACRIGERGMVEIARRFGLAETERHFDELLDYSEREARRTIAGLPDGTWRCGQPAASSSMA